MRHMKEMKNTRTKQNNNYERQKNPQINLPKSKSRIRRLAMHYEETNKQ